MKSETLLWSLQKMEFTRGLAPRHIEKLAEMAFEATFSEGDVLYNEGDLGDILYLIEEGLVTVETYVPSRGRVTIFTVGPGQLLGWSAFFPHKRKTASSRALKATRAIAISTPQLREVCQANCDLGYAIVWRIAEVIADRLKATRLQLMDIYGPTGEIK